VPGTAELAVITAKHAVADQRAQLQRDAAALFDGEVGDATACVQDPRTHEGLRRTDGEAAGAAAAVFRAAFVHRQRQVGEEFAEEEPGSGTFVDEHGVLADPAEATLLRES